MAKLTRLRVRAENGRTKILVLVKHPMETGSRLDEETKTPFPAHFIEQMRFEINGRVVAEAHLGPGVAPNPLTGIAISNARSGDRVTVHWIDNRGESDSAETLAG